jgi:hypothetical protein
LGAYGKPKASIKRLQTTGTGSYNLAKSEHEVLWKKNLYFKAVPDDSIHSIIDNIRKDQAIAKHEPRFLTVTNFSTLLAVDTRTGETLDIPFVDLGKNFDFFLPWAGLEKTRYIPENPADVKAAEKMAKLFDLLKQDNPAQDEKSVHALNVFLSRLLFCFFAEDTEIFSKSLFTNSIGSHTAEDGSDLSIYLEKLFDVLNTKDRTKYAQYLQAFPYVNGGLFATRYAIPRFSRKSRAMLIECGSELNWSQINPDIFGSMFQAVIHPDRRGNMGQHYTSVPNIMKVIEPLFLNDLYEEFRRSEDSPKKLDALLRRIEKIKVFDPACGSGNFLIIAYKELRKLEMEIFNRLKIISPQMGLALSGIQLSNFHGIELDDFAHEVAILSLWLAEHQMNVAFKSKFGSANPSLPLKQGGNVVCANAASVDWSSVCKNSGEDEIYVLGNPPYLGARQQSKQQKIDMDHTLGDIKGFSDLDYISIWFVKAAKYIRKTKAEYAFVSTNSIAQGVQVSLLWPQIYALGLEISFAHLSFKWTNSAKNNAGVTCVIIGIRQVSAKPKYLFNGSHRLVANNINGYLANADNVLVESRKRALSDLPPINYGSFALDDGNFTLTVQERDEIVNAAPEAKQYLRPFIGAKELLQGAERYCVWLADSPDKAMKIAAIAERVAKVRKWRIESEREATRKLAQTPHLFAEIRQPSASYLALPTISSERRNYLPVAFLEKEVIASNQIYVVPNAQPFHFGLLSSKMHIVWVKAVCGQLETRVRYSAAIGYNSFPVPSISDLKKREIAACALEVLAIRENYSEKSLADLYDPDDMPADLAEAHQKLDRTVDDCYSKAAMQSDEDRLNCLFKLYEKMTRS